jgi:hypothetical protein
MKSKFVGLLAFSLLMAVVLYSQQGPIGTPVQQSPTMLNAATKVADCNVAVNTTCTATATPAGSNYVYVTAIDMAICGDATGTVQSNVTWTTTNLTGAPIAWAYSTAINPNACIYKVITYNPAVKSTTPGTAVTLVSPAVALHTAYNANIYWYEAP